MEVPPLLAGLIGAAALASFSVWVWLAGRVSSSREIIPYQPREPVPWQGWDLAVVVALFMVAFSGVYGALVFLGRYGGPTGDMVNLLADGIAKVLVCGAAVAYLRRQYKATWFDLGLNLRKLKSAASLGFCAFLAACPLVYGLMYFLTKLVDYDHPMVKLLEKQPDTPTLLFATVSAVIVAPIAEELFFRVLLQGWFEALERHVRDAQSLGSTRLPSALPIYASSLIFALSHPGNGPDKIPLFVFALFLGFLYRQTHRLAPSVVTHVCLNALSMAQLWYAANQAT